MRLTPPDPKIGLNDGFTEANDLFGYADFGDRFANLVGAIDEPLVIVLDGPWGSGKSVFAKQWAGLLRQRGAPVIEFDAFTNDFYEDAFVALSAQIYAEAKKTLEASEDNPQEFLDKSKKLGKALAPTILRVLTRAVTAGFLSFEDVQAGGDAVKAGIEALGSEGEKAIDAALTERLTKANEDQQEMDAFKQTLSELAEAMMAANKKEGATGEENQKDGEGNEEGGQQAERREYPLVFIIDELDRCRPPFALSVVERIKHLFSVKGICFVLVTHLPQLETAVQGAYGPNVDSATYLQKFYHLPVRLPAPSDSQETRRARYIQHLWKALQIRWSNDGYDKAVIDSIASLADTHNLSLRALERVMTNFALVAASTGPNQDVVATIVIGLCVMRLKEPELYEKARVGQLTFPEVNAFLEGRSTSHVSNDDLLNISIDRDSIDWACCLLEEPYSNVLKENLQSFPRLLRIRRDRIVQDTCRYIDDLSVIDHEERWA